MPAKARKSNIKGKFIPALAVLLLVGSIASTSLINVGKVSAVTRGITFPVIGTSSYSNDFNAPRGSVKHNAIDILAKKGSPLVSAVNGTITDVQYPQPSWGYSVTIRDDSNYRYTYIHLNDDNPGTNDGKGDGMHAYAADIQEGNRVVAGQLIGKVGDSGRSNGVSHLHFEMYLPNGNVNNPFDSLNQAKRISSPVKSPLTMTGELLPFSPYFSGSSNVAMGNFDVDSDSEFAVGAGPGGGPAVNMYQPDNTLIRAFYAYDPGFKGGVDVGTGDINGDGVDEVITGAGRGGGPHVVVFRADGTVMESFLAFDNAIKNGLKVAAGDVTGDGKDEVIVGLSSGGEPRVNVFNLASGDPVLLKSFLAYDAGFRGGVDVAAGNVTAANPNDEIVTGAGPGGGPHVAIFKGDATNIGNFLAYSGTMLGGLRVSVGNVRNTSAEFEILTVPASGAGPRINMFNSEGTILGTKLFIEQWWRGGYDIGAGVAMSKGLASGNRRVTVRLGVQ